MTESSGARKETWDVSLAGVRGTETLIRRGADYHSTVKLGPVKEEHGQIGDRRWHVNENGVASPTKADDTASFVMLRVLNDFADPKNDVRLLGEVADPAPAYVVQVKMPHQKHLEWLFLDKKTTLITRSEHAITGGGNIVTTYEDYRFDTRFG